MTDRKVEELLPLKPAWFHILLALAEGPQHGYAIRSRAEGRANGRIKLWPATLYGSIHQMEEEGLIEALPDEEDPGGDARRCYYQLTALGSLALRAEASRLESLVQAVRAAGPAGEL
jgi:DNA-binding PadR family transcriptional regulator